MAPAVSEIRVQPDCTAAIRPFSDLVSRLFRLVGNIAYGCVEEDAMPVDLRLDMIRDLVHIKYDSEVDEARE
ncbi:hypothetical protein GGI20_005132 [Coemansia sp. BCRC 34301]|nr:hypothetical protein GGI20_005132 [Coemansia sp. BCRC 34301]